MRGVSIMTKVWIILFLFITLGLTAVTVSEIEMRVVAEKQLQKVSSGYSIFSEESITVSGQSIGTIFNLKPQGYIVTTANKNLPPIIAYSTTNNADEQKFHELVTTDISYRLQNVYSLPERELYLRNFKWDSLLSDRDEPEVEYWPPSYLTSTGGWVQTQWSQTGVYRMFCPMDLVSNSRSYAGCPSVAMAQIVNYHASVNEKEFTDEDDYYHNYGGNSYQIDDDYLAYDFLSFPQLNAYLDSLSYRMRFGHDLTDEDKASLVFACGVLAEQVYNSGGSGTFGVGQAMTAYERMNFEGMELLDESSPDLMQRMIDNMMEGKPVHYAVVTPAWDSGHNVVLDGYNSDGYFHINYGWGGSSDGWYLVPDEMQYGMTVCEGAVVDINHRHYVGAFPDEVIINTFEELCNPEPISIFNDTELDGLLIEAIEVEDCFGGMACSSTTELPYLLPFGETIQLELWIAVPVRIPYLYSRIKVIHEHGVLVVPVKTAPIDSADEFVQTVPDIKMSNYPNPFNPKTTISFTLKEAGEVDLSVYNLLGQKVKTIKSSLMGDGRHSIDWKGDDDNNNPMPSGIYFYKLKKGSYTKTKKMLLLK